MAKINPTIYVQFKGPDYKGGCTTKGHTEWSECVSYSHGMRLPVASSRSIEGGGTTGDPEHDELKITKVVDPISPKLVVALNNGAHHDTVTLEFVKPGGEEIVYMKIALENVVVTSIASGASPDSDSSQIQETIGLTYAKYSCEHSLMDEKGKKKGTVAAAVSLKEMTAK